MLLGLKHKLLFILYFTVSFSCTYGRQETDKFTISLLTYSPGKELYSTFGHSAIRVLNNSTGEDYIYNYGTFDFDEPNFYLKFLKGKLLYRLSRLPSDFALNQMLIEQRTVIENTLTLTNEEKQILAQKLEINYLPLNRNYYYDFFFDNCATRITSLINSVTTDRYAVKSKEYQPVSFKKLISSYLNQQPWAKLGIWLVIGKQGNIKADYEQATFLPDYLKEYLSNKYTENNMCLLDPDKILIHGDKTLSGNYFSPVSIFLIILMFFIGLKYYEIKKNCHLQIPDKIALWISLILSLFLILLTLVSEQEIFNWNSNLLWTVSFPVIIMVRKKLFIRISLFVYLIGMAVCFIQVRDCLSLLLLNLIITTRLYKSKYGLLPDIFKFEV